MKEFISLKILDRFSSVFERFGCDYPTMRKILEVKLTMDARRVPTVMMRGARAKSGEDTERNSFMRSLWLYGFMGLITLPFVLMSQNYVFQMSTTFAILMFLVMTSMISDFSSVLLDIRDRVIISTKPVRGRTISFARAIHIVIYLVLLTGALTLPALVGALVRHGVVFFLIFLLDVFLLDVLVLVITALLYLFILNIFDGERLKDIINYVQIALSLAILVGYQLVGRSFDLFKLHIAFHPAWWQVLVPPVWFGSTFAWLQHTAMSPQIVTLAVLAVLVPFVLFVAYIRLMPLFERKLQKLAEDAAKSTTRGQRVLRIVGRLICRTEEERAFFHFGSLMMAREREFKLKVYPSLGFSMVFPFIMILNPAWSHGLQSVSSTKLYLTIYMVAIMIPSVLMMLKFSGKYKAAWLYKAAPVASADAVYRGTMKAFLVRLLLPVFLVDGAVFTAIFGFRVVPQLIAAGLSMLVYTVICFRFLDKTLPFSRPFEVVPQSNRYAALLLLALILVLVGIHFVFTLLPPFGIYVYLLLLVGVNIVAWRYGFRVNGAGLRSRTGGAI